MFRSNWGPFFFGEGGEVLLDHAFERTVKSHIGADVYESLSVRDRKKNDGEIGNMESKGHSVSHPSRGWPFSEVPESPKQSVIGLNSHRSQQTYVSTVITCWHSPTLKFGIS